MSLNGWHPGERLVRHKLNYDKDPSLRMLYTYISGDLDPHHAVFHSNNLPFLPITTLDADGRPWGSILSAEDGKPGFIDHPGYSVLTARTRIWDGDPLKYNANAFFNSDGSLVNEGQDMLVAGIGIEFPTRRRNKLAGKISRLHRKDDVFTMEFSVNESIGNCPKYINARDLIPYPNTAPRVQYRVPHLSPEDRLPDEIIAFIQQADTVFFGTTYAARKEDKELFPSHVGMNQRGGRPGFIRVLPSDGRTVVLPDYSGNRIMTSLGNVEATPLASLTFVSFESGDILYLTGTAKNHFGDSAQRIMALQNQLTTTYVTGFVHVQDALTVRQRPGTVPERSPYSPPIKFLIEESSNLTLFDGSDSVTALLSSIDLHSNTIATFTWESSQDLEIHPGQAVILDLEPFLGSVKYQHMAPRKPSSINDDRIRTWTVSSAHVDGPTRTFSLTIKLKPGGAATSALFAIATKLKELKPELLRDTRPLGLNLKVLGVTGEFSLGDMRSLQMHSTEVKKFLWIAGGIGITPFLSMLRGISSMSTSVMPLDITLILSTREPEVLLPIIADIFKGIDSDQVTLSVWVFSNDLSCPSTKLFNCRRGRLTVGFFVEERDVLDTEGRDVLLCGSPAFEQVAIDGLGAIGVSPERIRREKFTY